MTQLLQKTFDMVALGQESVHALMAQLTLDDPAGKATVADFKHHAETMLNTMSSSPLFSDEPAPSATVTMADPSLGFQKPDFELYEAKQAVAVDHRAVATVRGLSVPQQAMPLARAREITQPCVDLPAVHVPEPACMCESHVRHRADGDAAGGHQAEGLDVLRAAVHPPHQPPRASVRDLDGSPREVHLPPEAHAFHGVLPRRGQSGYFALYVLLCASLPRCSGFRSTCLHAAPSAQNRDRLTCLGDARPAIVHTTLMLLHHVLSLCAEKEDANSAMKGMRIEIVPALLAAASGGQTECRVMLANNTCYSVRDGSLVRATLCLWREPHVRVCARTFPVRVTQATAAMLCTSYIDGSTVKDLLAPISSTVKEQSETEGCAPRA
eukprot:5179950-Prymnesium_polylepis.1